MKFENFLNTMVGSIFKVWASAVLGQVLIILNDKDQTLWSFQSLEALGILSGTAVIPMIINALNRTDARYGNQQKKTVEIVEKETEILEKK